MTKAVYDLEALRQMSVDTLTDPIDEFIRTGFYVYRNPYYTPEDERAHREAHDLRLEVPDYTARRICRYIAKQLRRPFIRVSEHSSTKGGWLFAEVDLPKRVYLRPMLAPVFLAGAEVNGRGYYPPQATRAVQPQLLYWVSATRVRVKFRDQALFNQFMVAWDTPKMRAARRLPADPSI